MRNQEFGQYAGGLLAVSLAHLPEVIPLLTPIFCRMGKTIQMIALVVSGSARPNLVVACVFVLLPFPSSESDLTYHTVRQLRSCSGAMR